MKKTIILIIIILLISINTSQATYTTEKNQKQNIKSSIFDKLKRGDLVFCEIKEIFIKMGGVDVKSGFDHVAIYLGRGNIKNGKFIKNNLTGTHYVIEATFLPFTKVRYTRLSLLRLYSQLQFARVNNSNQIIIEEAIDFGESQLGCGYQHFGLKPKTENPMFPWQYEPWEKDELEYKFHNHANNNPDDPDDPFSDWYYCADLAWSCYYNAGIDLDPIYPEDRNQDGIADEIEGYGLLRYVTPQDIFDNDKTIEIEI